MKNRVIALTFAALLSLGVVACEGTTTDDGLGGDPAVDDGLGGDPALDDGLGDVDDGTGDL